jgi:RNA polymerase sigma-70 factor (ECF subfamily)
MSDKNTDINALLYSVAVNGDEVSYRLLFNHLFPSVKRFTYCFLKSRQLAEEAASDVMISIWQNRQKLLEIENIRVYLFVLAKNKCLSILKNAKSKKNCSLNDITIDITFSGMDPEQLYINSEILQKVEKAVNSLPQRCKLIFKLVKEERMSYKEVADILNISVKTVDAQLVTALKKITEAVKLEYAI